MLAIRREQSPCNAVRQMGWRPLFEGCNPSPTDLAFFNGVFDFLDMTKTGLLTPEQYSAFLDVQGYLPDEDVCKYSNLPYPTPKTSLT